MLWLASPLWLLAAACSALEAHSPYNHIHQLQWSSESLMLRRGSTMHIYHNYTVDESRTGNQTTRFLRYQTIPYHNQLLQNRGPRFTKHSLLKKRGFILNPSILREQVLDIDNAGSHDSRRYVTWNWKRETPACPVVIRFCFPNPNHQAKLKPIVDAAFKMWADALGEERGLHFMYTNEKAEMSVPAGICFTPAGEWLAPPDAVVLALDDRGRRAYNGIGWQPPGYGRRDGYMAIFFDPGDDASEAAEKENIVAMAHELGHVMGLEHEHQRYDARDHITFKPENIKNFEKLAGAIAEYNEEEGDELGIDDVIDDRYQAYSLGLKDRYDIPLIDILPFRRGDDGYNVIDFELDGGSMRILPQNLVIVLTLRLGEFDFDSIMLYGSLQESKDGSSPVMVRKSNGRPFTDGSRVTDGDVRAVKRIYPDNVAQQEPA